jgi:hypothetical protein
LTYAAGTASTEEYKDTYTDVLRAAIEAKVEGKN